MTGTLAPPAPTNLPVGMLDFALRVCPPEPHECVLVGSSLAFPLTVDDDGANDRPVSVLPEPAKEVGYARNLDIEGANMVALLTDAPVFSSDFSCGLYGGMLNPKNS